MMMHHMCLIFLSFSYLYIFYVYVYFSSCGAILSLISYCKGAERGKGADMLCYLVKGVDMFGLLLIL